MRNSVKWVFICALAFGFASCSLFGLQGDGNVVVQERLSGENIAGIRSEGVFNITVTQGAIAGVRVVMDQNLQGHLYTVIQSGVVVVFSDETLFPTSYDIEVTLPVLTSIASTGTGNITAAGFAGAGSLSVTSEGTGNVTISGSGTGLTVASTGTGNLNAYGYSVTNANVTLCGTGNAYVNVSGTINYTLTGTGNCVYKGSAVKSGTATGLGRCTQY